MSEDITPELLLSAYAQGYFPMAESHDDPKIYWFYPEMRGIIPLENFHVPRSLARLLKKNPFEITFNKAFAEVMRGCAEREKTWINGRIIKLYCELHTLGFAHSMECWKDSKLVGGIYGVSLGRAFFGESMFSRVPNASKAALATLLEHLKNMGYTLFDTQYINEHLKQFGGLEIPREAYLGLLEAAIRPHPETTL